MLQDVLTQEQRLRLEALAQAVAHNITMGGPKASPEKIRNDAKVFEKYIRGEHDGD